MTTITDFLNQMNQVGVFSYVLPFLLIFAVVFAILEKTGIFKRTSTDQNGNKTVTDGNKGISAIIAVAIGLLSLQFDGVSIFFARIFPNVGIGISIILVILILVGLAGVDIPSSGTAKAIGWIVAIAAALWAIFNWGDLFSSGYGFSGYWFGQYFWTILWLLIVIGIIFAVTRSSGSDDED